KLAASPRIDSLIFTAPVFFYFIRYCCY
ncbi:hypothetical protein, partial [Escherichia coli]